MKIGVVGAGRILSSYIEAAKHSDIEIAALCDIGDPILPTAANELPLFADFRDMAKLPQLEAFLIAVPSSMHFEVANIALGEGRPLLIEKPVTLKPEQFDQLRDAACAQSTPVFSLLHAQYGAEVITARKQLLKRKQESEEPVAINWHTSLCDPYAQNAAVQSSLINAWVDGGINAISIVLAALPDVQLTRISGQHTPEDEDWAQTRSRQSFELSGDWAGTVTIEVDWSLGHGTKASHAELGDSTRIDLYHTNEAIEIRGGGNDIAQSFQNDRPRLVNHYIEAFKDAREHIEQGQSNWEFSHSCHESYFSCFP